jgi:hypothetical protein
VFLRINGRDIASLGLELADQGAVWSAPASTRGNAPMLNRIGARSSALASFPGKTLTVILPLPESPSTRRAALDRVLAHLDGLLVLEWDDAPGRVQYGQLETAEISARFQSVAWTVGHLNLPLVIRIDSPAWFEWGATTVATSANVPAPVPLGTLPVAPLIRISDTTAGAITIEYRGITGALLSSLVISNPALSSGQELFIDCGTERILKWTGSAFEAANALFSSGSFPVLDPGDGNSELEAWPTLVANRPLLIAYRKLFA